VTRVHVDVVEVAALELCELSREECAVVRAQATRLGDADFA